MLKQNFNLKVARNLHILCSGHDVTELTRISFKHFIFFKVVLLILLERGQVSSIRSYNTRNPIKDKSLGPATRCPQGAVTPSPLQQANSQLDHLQLFHSDNYRELNKVGLPERSKPAGVEVQLGSELLLASVQQHSVDTQLCLGKPQVGCH